MRRPPGALQFVNGSNQYVLANASATTNNMSTATVAMWVNLTTVTVAAQRNFWGKSTGVNRFVGFISPSQVTMNYAGTSTSACTVNLAGMPYLVANIPIFLAWTVDFGTAAPKCFNGTLTNPAIEPTYAGQTNGSGAHDDSGAGFTFANGSGGGTTNTLPGQIYSVQVFNKVLTQDEVRAAQYQWNPNARACVLAWRMGKNGAGPVWDESGNANHGAITGAIPTNSGLTGAVMR